MPAPTSRRSATVTAFVMVAGSLAWIIGIWTSRMEGAKGFFGPAPLIADANLILEIFLVAGLSYGFLLARRGNIDAHKINQTTWVVLNIGLIALVMAGSMQDVTVERASELANWRVGITWLHAAAGILTAIAGLWIVLQMNGALPPFLQVAGWKNLMRATLAGYWATALLGGATYVFWYIA